MFGTVLAIWVWCAEFYTVENRYRAEEELDIISSSLTLVPSQRWVGVPCLCNVTRKSLREELSTIILSKLSELDRLFRRILRHDLCSFIDQPRMKFFDYWRGGQPLRHH